MPEDCPELECCPPDPFENAIPTNPTYLNIEQSFTFECPPGFSCTPGTYEVTIPAGAVSFTPGEDGEVPENGTVNGPAGPCVYEGYQEYVNCVALQQAAEQAYAGVDQTQIFYVNTEQSVSCPVEKPVGGPFIIAAGTVATTVSQEAANAMAIALGQAQAAANCLYGNELTQCECPPDEACCLLPNNHGPWEVAANTYSSAISQEDANAQAQADCEAQMAGGCATPVMVNVGTFPGSCFAAPASGAAGQDYVFVCNEGSNNLTVINSTTQAVVATIALGTTPRSGIHVAEVNRCYVSCENGIHIINPLTLTDTGTIAWPAAATGSKWGPNFCLDSFNNRLYIPISDSFTGTQSVLVSVNYNTNAASVLVALPANGANDDNFFGFRAAYCDSDDRIYIAYQFYDDLNQANNQIRLRKYTPAGGLVSSTVLQDGASGYFYNPRLYYVPQTGYIYQTGNAGSTNVGFRVYNPGSASFVFNGGVDTANDGTISYQPSCDMIIHFANIGGPNVIMRMADGTELCRIADLGGHSAAGSEVASIAHRSWFAQPLTDQVRLLKKSYA